MTVHLLPEVAAAWRLDEQMTHPVLWLTRRIKAGQLRARKLGRNWVMTEDDLAYNLDRLANTAVAPDASQPPAAPVAGVPSLASMRRRRSA